MKLTVNDVLLLNKAINLTPEIYYSINGYISEYRCYTKLRRSKKIQHVVKSSHTNRGDFIITTKTNRTYVLELKTVHNIKDTKPTLDLRPSFARANAKRVYYRTDFDIIGVDLSSFGLGIRFCRSVDLPTHQKYAYAITTRIQLNTIRQSPWVSRIDLLLK